MSQGPSPEEGFTVTDRRRIDPVTGEPRVAPAAAGPTGPDVVVEGAPDAAPATVGTDPADARVAELTADLQRVQAEYANYRKRVERDREAVREQAAAMTLADFLPVLDDIDRARSHGELEGGFKSVAEAVEATVARAGLERYGAEGEEFDPSVHEALTHSADDTGTDGPTITVVSVVYAPGYSYAGRVVRPARVGVADVPAPADAEAPSAASPTAAPPTVTHDAPGAGLG